MLRLYSFVSSTTLLVERILLTWPDGLECNEGNCVLQSSLQPADCLFSSLHIHLHYKRLCRGIRGGMKCDISL